MELIKQYGVMALAAWLLLAVPGALVMYVGYGFAMSAKRARDDAVNPSPKHVVVVDSLIAFPFIVLDALLNLIVMPVICLDFRPGRAWDLITGRLCKYNADPQEWAYRRWIADLVAAFLDAKDPSGDHIKGENARIKWLY